MHLPAALPHLEGRRGDIVRIVYWVAAALTLVVIAGSIVFNGVDFFRNVPASMGFGFRTYTEDYRPVVGEVSGVRARGAGLVEGGVIVAIDGTVLPEDATEFDVGARLAAAGPQVMLAVRNAKGAARSYRVAREPAVWTATDPSSGTPVWVYAIISFLGLEAVPLFFLAASLLLAQRRPRDPEAMLFAFAFLLLCYPGDVVFWVHALLYVPIAVMANVTVAGWQLLYIAVAGFPDGRFANRPARIVAGGTATLLVGDIIYGLITTRSELYNQIFSILIILFVILTAVAVLLRYRRTPPGAQKQQIKWVAMGFAVTAVGALIVFPMEAFGIVLPTGDPIAFLFGQLSLLMLFVSLPLGLLVSLLRYRLYDADAAISRSAAYVVLTVALLGIFTVSEKLIEIVGAGYFGGNLGTVAGGVAAALAAVAITPLHTRLTTWAERRFQRGLVRLRDSLPALMADMRETASPAALAETVIARVEAGVRARRSALVMGDTPIALRGIEPNDVADWQRGWTPSNGDTLDCQRRDMVFPMRVPLAADGCGRVGWLLLGPRPDGSFYGKDEREVLGEIADPVARALAVAEAREANATAVAEVAHGLRARIASLEATMTRLLRGGSATPAN